MRSDLFPHFLNRDTRSIAGTYKLFSEKAEVHEYWVKIGLNTCAILCENRVLMPPGFVLECDIAFKVISQNIDYLTSGLLAISLKENNFLELVEKKRNEYSSERSIYKGIYDDQRVEYVSQHLPFTHERNFSAGKIISSSWEKSPDSNKLIWKDAQNSLGLKQLSTIARIPNQLISNGKAATWAAISKEINVNTQEGKFLRNALQHEYFMGYINDAKLNIVKNIPYVFTNFNIKPKEKVYCFRKLSICFDSFNISDFITNGKADFILKIRGLPVFIDFIDCYAQLCLRFNSDADLKYVFTTAASKAKINWEQERLERCLELNAFSVLKMDKLFEGLENAVNWLRLEYNLLQRCKALSKKESTNMHNNDNIQSEYTIHDVIVIAAQQELSSLRKSLIDLEIHYKSVDRLAGLSGDVFSIKTSKGKIRNIGCFLATKKGKSGMNELLNLVLKQHQPEKVIMVGMMAGIKGKCNLLDVVCPRAIYDVLSVGTDETGLQVGPETSSVDPFLSHWILQYDWDKFPLSFQSSGFELITHKKSLCVADKWDSLTHDICKKSIGIDEGNIIGLEMEGSAISEAQLSQTIEGKSVKYIMIKGVADYAGETISEGELVKLNKMMELDLQDEEPDPTNNKLLKKQLQFQSTRNAVEVALRVITECA